MTKRVLVAFAGTRGDAQPYLLAAKALLSAGFEVLATGNEDAAGLAESFGVAFKATRIPAKEIATNAKVVEAFNEQSITKIIKAEQDFMTEDKRRREWESLYEAMVEFRPSLVLSGGISILCCIVCGRALRIPVLSLSLQRWRPSRYTTPYGMPKLPPSTLNRTLWDAVHWMFLQAAQKNNGPDVERLFQRPVSELFPSVTELNSLISSSAEFRSLVAESHALHGDFPPDFNSNIIRLGPLIAGLAEQNGPEFGAESWSEVESFLDRGDAPVFFGFGSMICKSSRFMTLLSLRALRLTGLRGILAAAWSEMSAHLVDGEPDAEELKAYCKEKVLFVKNAPHGSLFPRCRVIVHHGGAGTTNASARSGVPTVILPLSFDQFDHADRVNQRGIGVGMAPMSGLAPQEVAEAIRRCADSADIRERARDVGAAMAKEDGLGKLVDAVRSYFQEFIDTGRHLQMQDDLQRRRSRRWLQWCLPCS